MKHPRIKLIVSLVALAVVTVMLGGAFLLLNIGTAVMDNDHQTTLKLEAVQEMFTSLLKTRMDASIEYSRKNLVNAELMALSLRSVVRQEGDGAIRSYENGCILKLDGDALIYPEGDAIARKIKMKDLIGEDGKNLPHGVVTFTDDGEASDEDLVCSFCRVLGDYYYVDYLTRLLTEMADAETDINAIITQVGNAFGGDILVFSSVDDDMVLFFAPDSFEKYANTPVADMNISLEEGFVGTVTLDDEIYRYTVSGEFSIPQILENIRIALLIPQTDSVYRQWSGIAILLGVAFLALAALTVWVLASVFKLRSPYYHQSDRLRYAPSRARGAALCIGMIGVIAVMVTTLLVVSLVRLIGASQSDESVLNMVEVMLEQNQERDANLVRQRNELYSGQVRRIADVLYRNPSLQTAENLQEICDYIGADYLMLYDSKGNEKVSNSPYIHLSFGTDEASSTYDFRRLLLGVPSIVHDVCVDEQTGLNRQLTGASVGSADSPNGYEALILAMKPPEGAGMLKADDLIRSLTTADSLCFAVDGESGSIVHASNGDYVGENALSLGLSQNTLRSDFMGFFTFDESRWFGQCEEIDGLFFFAATRESALFADLQTIALLLGAIFLLCYALLALVLLFGYTQKNIDACCGQAIPDDEPLPGEGARGFRFMPGNARQWWRDKSSAQKAWLVVEVLLGIELISGVAAMRRGMNAKGGAYLLYYVFNGSWDTGFNLFAFTKIAVLALGVTLLILALKLLSGVVGSVLDKRGRTVSVIVFNLFQYVLIAAAIYYAFLFVGINITTPLASLAAMSFAITLLFKDFISDILAGVGTVFSNSYQIGDYVEISGFRGWVKGISMSATTLVNTDGNIKVFNNRDVRNVLNMSRGNSRYIVNITIGYDQPLEQIEALLEAELPKIGARITQIENGPVYLGMTDYGHGGITLSIAAPCQERDYATVRRKLNAELQRLFRDNNISIR